MSQSKADVEETVAQSEDQQVRSQEASRSAPPSVEGYELQMLLGTGSYGEVWGGLQQSTGQRVAVKLFRERSKTELEYFRRELERLREVADHPSIVHLLDANLESEPAYFVMPWLPCSLSQRVKAREPSLEEITHWFEQLARGLQHTHEKGLLHCDLKPSNVMLDEGDRVRLADFGQSRQVGEGLVAWGTLGFMAPEQTLLSSELAGATPSVRWDIYGLGATLYRLLTGRCPYLRDEELQKLQKLGLEDRLRKYRQRLLEARYRTPKALNDKVDQDLSDLVSACLERDPQRRPAAMALVLEDLARRKRGDPLLCQRPWSPSYRCRKWLSKPLHAVASGLSLLVLGTTLASYLSLHQAYNSQQHLVAALFQQQGNQRQQQLRVEEATLWWKAALEKMPPSPQRQGLSRSLARQHFGLLDWRQGVERACPGPGTQYAYVTQGKAYVADASRPEEEPRRLSLEPGLEAVEALYHWRTDYWFVRCRQTRSGEQSILLSVWDSTLKKKIYSMEVAGETARLAFEMGPEGRLLTFSGSSELACWDVREGRLRWKVVLDPQAQAHLQDPPARSEFDNAEFSPDGRWLLVHQQGLQSYLLDLRQVGPPTSRQALGPSDSWARRGNFSPDGNWLRFNRDFYNLETGELLPSPLAGEFMGFLDSEQVLVAEGHRLRLGNFRKPQQRVTEFVHNEAVDRAVAMPTHLLSQTSSGRLHVWDLATGSLLTCKEAQLFDEFLFWGAARAFCLLSPGKEWKAWRLDPPAPTWKINLASSHLVGLHSLGSSGPLLAVQPDALHWLDRQGKILKRLDLSEQVRSSLALADGSLLFEGASKIGMVTGGPDKPLLHALASVQRAQPGQSFSPFASDRSGKVLAVAENQAISFWDAQAQSQGQLVCPGVRAVALSSDGRWLAALSSAGLFSSQKLHLWKLPGREPQTLPESLEVLKSSLGPVQLHFAPNGHWLLARNNDAYAVFEIPTGKVLAHWEEPSWLKPFRFSPSGSEVLIPTGHGTARLRSLPSGQVSGSYLGDTSASRLLQASAFHPSGQPLILATDQRACWIDPLSGAEVLPGLPQSEVLHACWGDSQSLFLGDRQGQVWRWDFPDQVGASEEARTGYRLLPEAGSLVPLTREQWLKER